MSLHLITAKIIHLMCSFLFGVILFGAAAVGILTGQVLSVYPNLIIIPLFIHSAIKALCRYICCALLYQA